MAALDPLPRRPSNHARNSAFRWRQHHAEPTACAASGSDRVRRGLQPLPPSASHAATATDGISCGQSATYAREEHSGGRHVCMAATTPHERTSTQENTRLFYAPYATLFFLNAHLSPMQ